MQSIVSIRQCHSYDVGLLRGVIERSLDDIGGLSQHVKTGDRVLLKPNLLLWAKPEKAIVTHPAFVEAVAGLVKDAGGKLFIGDSPPIGMLRSVLGKSGYKPFMERLDVTPVPFSEKKLVEIAKGRTFRRIELAKEVFDHDVVINLPKLKTHGQMLLTLGVKNLFGTVIGSDKPSWHLRAGRDYDTFATVLVQIYEAVRPAVTVLDGILAMEGDGPNNGTPRHLGLVGASEDATALDATVCRLVGYPVESFRTCVIAQSLGVGISDADRIDVTGDELTGLPLSDFAPPGSLSITWGMSQKNLVRRFLESHLVMRPDIQADACALCKVCLEHCPPGAIKEKNGRLTIDYDTCISCFCCQELCTSDAIRVKQPLLGRALSRVFR